MGFQSFLKDTLLHLYIRKSLAVLKGGLFSQPSPMTHHHHGLTFCNLGKFPCGHTLGPFGPLDNQLRNFITQSPNFSVPFVKPISAHCSSAFSRDDFLAVTVGESFLK